ncbi:conserved hypothetical protein [Xylanimonas cellulosilytica DSM 15894]|uniref:Uncharacterized protein n=1 Tax=Xylanimonas cellulosilytica (strain DSM 15894 / JCM 12276 / CECT 5975 / KCTC 9989 / LMG 20990 / NBRC 107835 / XIL07) TaxID=446471 RepID=D1C0E1_XYLCX|nr:hypothetical protein [Xylanimonas cellulosilytica]ACZ30330.1 conserved hypothetical protein [Xylanimonas cellulosilytica DSM 15894]
MTDTDVDLGLVADELAAVDGIPLDRLPIRVLPLRRYASGTYVWSKGLHLPIVPVRDPIAPRGLTPVPDGPQPGPLPGPLPGPFPVPSPFPVPFPLPGDRIPFPVVPRVPVLPIVFLLREELRIDVDGSFPQMTVSGTSISLLRTPRTWIARVERVATPGVPWVYEGEIWYTDAYGAGEFPYTRAHVAVVPPDILGRGGVATLTLTAPNGASSVRTYPFSTRSYHPVAVEFDSTSDAEPITQIATHAHPNRPPTLAGETLSIDTVFRRAGFDVSHSPGGAVPLSGAGANGTWSDAEMHDAMQTYWSRFANAPQWALWTFWARLHDRGTSLGGIMFDDIGPNHRQGTAIFTGSFIRTVPAGDTAPDAWDRRMRFWTAVHEMGHAFNLAHSWQKDLQGFGSSWIPLTNDTEARSFMNYPYNVSGGQAAFFADFGFRFTDEELVFLRHAPARFVQQGNADWFDHHNLEQVTAVLPPDDLRLEVRANREHAQFEFLEPVVLELKVTNASPEPKLVRADLLDPQHVLTILHKEGAAPRQWVPYARSCTQAEAVVLMPGESVYAPLPAFAGLNGWDVSEPGTYSVVCVVEIDGVPVVSQPFTLRVAPPRTVDAERLATDVLTDRVGRALSFGGTALDEDANDVLRQAVETLPGSRVAIHAAAALALPLAREFKQLDLPEGGDDVVSAAQAGGSLTARGPDVDAALAIADRALSTDAAAETLGHIGARTFVESFAENLAEAGAAEAASSVQGDLLETFRHRGVKASVVEEVAAKAASLGKRARRRTARGDGRKRP